MPVYPWRQLCPECGRTPRRIGWTLHRPDHGDPAVVRLGSVSGPRIRHVLRVRRNLGSRPVIGLGIDLSHALVVGTILILDQLIGLPRHPAAQLRPCLDWTPRVLVEETGQPASGCNQPFATLLPRACLLIVPYLSHRAHHVVCGTGEFSIMKFLVETAEQRNAAHCPESDVHWLARIRVKQGEERDLFARCCELLRNLERQRRSETVSTKQVWSHRLLGADQPDHSGCEIFYLERRLEYRNGDQVQRLTGRQVRCEPSRILPSTGRLAVEIEEGR